MTLDSIFSIAEGSAELGLIYAILALGVFLSFRTLNTPDLTVDGSIVTGMAASVMVCSGGGNPYLALLAAFAVGCIAGSVTALLNTKLGIQPLLAGILVMLGSYSVNLRIMGGKANVAIINSETVYTGFKKLLPMEFSSLILGVIILALVTAAFHYFLRTRLGFALRATGDNEDMVKASGINSNAMRLIGLSLSNGMVGLAGGLLGQYQSVTDAGMGVGMVVIGLASVIIGEAIFGTKSLLRRLIAVSLGAILYRMIIAFAFSLGMPSTDLKLVSAAIVTVALSTGMLGEKFSIPALLKKGGAKNA